MPVNSKITRLLLCFTVMLVVCRAHANITDEFPSLKKYTFREKDTSFYLGVGVSPISLLSNQILFTANVFELHYIKSQWDFELLTASFGMSVSSSAGLNSNHFTLRTAPKYRINHTLSIGPLLGWEFVSFPNITARFYKGDLFSPDQPFSGNGLIYGGEANENFSIGSDYFLKISQVCYKQTYSVTQTPEGWTYYYDRPDIQANPSTIGPGWVFMLEVSLLY